ncbi:MAG TPA: integrase arm-type DNA-binding domain-containing protein [Rhodanobacteraceae bacterium]|nr:integrase arm-type DNA-binding domain-containing protein [Rhodanobacteraceae bacterium]
MPKRINPLSPSAVANARPKKTACTLRDGFGLLLLVKPEGGKLWRFDYRRPGTGKRNTLSLGTYPDVSLKRAREKRDDARKLLADGIDPGEKRKAEAQAPADTFEAVAREWFAKYSPQWAEDHANRNIRRLERDVFPWIGSKPLANVTAPDILAVLERIDARGARETAHRARTNIGQVIRFGIATGRTNFDPTVALRGAIPPATERNHAAVTEPEKVGELLRAIDGYKGHFPTRCALQLAPMFFVRPGELRQAEWAEIDLDAAQWNLPADKMKMRQPHIVPLATQAVAILRALYPLTGSGRYVFPGGRSPKRPMSNNATNAALRRMGFDKDTMTTHGFRAMARTILDEELGFRPDYIEHQLAHAVRDPNGRAYNRTAHLPERRKMMQTWADFLDSLRDAPGKVVPIRRKA